MIAHQQFLNLKIMITLRIFLILFFIEFRIYLFTVFQVSYDVAIELLYKVNSFALLRADV